jgi:hypothetical protein
MGPGEEEEGALRGWAWLGEGYWFGGGRTRLGLLGSPCEIN